eukprot:5942236-Ditylum_brightwellii.AAC.1
MVVVNFMAGRILASKMYERYKSPSDVKTKVWLCIDGDCIYPTLFSNDVSNDVSNDAVASRVAG